MRLVLGLLLLLATGACAAADDGFISGVGGAIQLMQDHPSIAMERMEVDVHLSPERAAQVDCHFTFHNTGSAVTVKMGFPERGYGDESEGFDSFASWVDGKKVPTRIAGSESHGGDWSRWRVKTVKFAAGQTRVIRVKYTTSLGGDTSGNMGFEYQVHTGASWKGPIGYARVRLYADYFRDHWNLSTHLTGFRATAKSPLTWERRSFEPTSEDNIGFGFIPIVEYLEVGHGIRMTEGWGYPDYEYVRKGVFFLPVRSLADFVGAALTVRGREVDLQRSEHLVTVRLKQSWMLVDGKRVDLPAAPYLTREKQLRVPVRAVARALGVPVTYDKQQHITRLHPLLADALSLALPKQAAADAYNTFSAHAPGWVAPAWWRFTPEVQRYAKQYDVAQPWLAVGDFNGDSLKEVAALLIRGGAAAVVVTHHSELTWLQGEPALQPGRVRSLGRYLQVRHPGDITYYADDPAAPGERRTMTLNTDAVEVVDDGKGASLYYWSPEQSKFLTVVTGD